MNDLGEKMTYNGRVCTLVEMALAYNNKIRLTLQDDENGKIYVFSNEDIGKKIFWVN